MPLVRIEVGAKMGTIDLMLCSVVWCVSPGIGSHWKNNNNAIHVMYTSIFA